MWEDRYPRTPKELFDFLSDPVAVPQPRQCEITRVRDSARITFSCWVITVRAARIAAAGESDDSAWDSSGRKPWEVPRKLLTGKAFYVYWPHGVPVWPDIPLTHDFHVPFVPYLERMKWIR